jgi:hypothetical protein
MAWCKECEPYGGVWKLVINSKGDEGMKRCDCPDSARITAAVEARKKAKENPVWHPPVLNEHEAAAFVEMLAGAMKFTPGDGLSRALIGEELRSMVHDASEAMWLTKRMSRLYTDWPGVKEMRRVYCKSGRIPLDGVLDDSPSEIYTADEGIPPERQIPPTPDTLRIGGRRPD